MPRIKYGSIIRMLVLSALICLWIQIMMSATENSGDLDMDDTYAKATPVEDGADNVAWNRTHQDWNIQTLQEELMNSNETSQLVLSLVPPELHKFLVVRPRNVTAGNTTESLPRNISDIRRLIQNYNDAQTIQNEDIFGPIQNDTVIIAIQVHTRLTYLRHLVVSLAQARGIDSALLVFSHDYYDEEINALVQSIDFCRVLQIFYPYSIQTHPNEFPGLGPNDCPRDAKLDQAVKLGCVNALHPDGYGHYREARYTQTKHHWWWKANRIFSQLHATTDHTGLVVFLEEDHYVAEDFLHVLKLMQSTADQKCPQCEILCLGTYLKTYQYHTDKKSKSLLGDRRVDKKKVGTQAWGFQVFPHLYGYYQKVEITPWHSSVHNMGMAFNRTVWLSMVADAEEFCLYDDYNWDYSLLHLSQNRQGKEKFKVMLCKGPRVFHIGECGLHHKKSNCNTNTVVNKVQKLVAGAKSKLYPSRLQPQVTTGGVKANRRLKKGNGGWGDIRDRGLCMNMTKEGRQRRKPYGFLLLGLD